MGAPQAHGIPPRLLLLAAAEKKQFEESSHYIPSDCLCVVSSLPGERESKQRPFCLRAAGGKQRANEGQNFCQLEIRQVISSPQTKVGLGLSLVGPSALESEGEW